MAKRSDIEAQMAALQEQLDNADTDDEVWIKDDSGREFKVTGKRATSVLARFEDLWKTDDAGDDDGQDDGQDDDDAGKAGAREGYFKAKGKAK